MQKTKHAHKEQQHDTGFIYPPSADLLSKYIYDKRLEINLCKKQVFIVNAVLPEPIIRQ